MNLFLINSSPDKMTILTFVVCAIEVNHELVNPLLLNHVHILRTQEELRKQFTPALSHSKPLQKLKLSSYLFQKCRSNNRIDILNGLCDTCDGNR